MKTRLMVVVNGGFSWCREREYGSVSQLVDSRYEEGMRGHAVVSTAVDIPVMGVTRIWEWVRVRGRRNMRKVKAVGWWGGGWFCGYRQTALGRLPDVTLLGAAASRSRKRCLSRSSSMSSSWPLPCAGLRPVVVAETDSMAVVRAALPAPGMVSEVVRGVSRHSLGSGDSVEAREKTVLTDVEPPSCESAVGVDGASPLGSTALTGVVVSSATGAGARNGNE